MKRTLVYAVVLTAVTIFIAHAGMAAIFNVRNAPYNAYGDGVHDDTQPINEAIQAAIAAGPGSEVYIPTGTYFLDSNYTIGIVNANGLTIYGDPTTELVNGGTNDFFNMQTSQNVTIDMLKFDTQPFRFTQGTVNSINAANSTISVTMDSGYQAPNLSFFSGCPIDFWTDPTCLAYDRSIYNTFLGATQVSGNNWTISLGNGAIPTDIVGCKFAIWNDDVGGWPFNLGNNIGTINITDVTYSGGGAGGTIGMWGNNGPINLTRVTVGIPPGSNRMASAAAGFTCQGNHGTITFNDCSVSRIQDDMFDCGADLSHILAQTAGNQITVANPGGTVENYYVGDTVQLWYWTYQDEQVNTTATVTAVSRDGSGNWLLTLNKNVTIHKTGPFPTGSGDLNAAQEQDGIDRCVNVNAAAPIVVENCSLQDSGRIFDLKCPNSVIENNLFYDTPWCIFSAAETYWHGGPAPFGVTVANNTFRDVDVSPIEFEVRYSLGPGSDTNNVVENNTFTDCGSHSPLFDGVTGPQCDIRGGGIRLCNSANDTISNNAFIGNWGPSIVVQTSNPIQVSNNVILNSHPNTWSDFNNYVSDGVNVDMGADVWLDQSSNLSLFKNCAANDGPYETHIAEATSTSSAIIGLSGGVATATVQSYEAEDATVNDAQVRTGGNASGNEYVGNINNSDSYVEFNVTVPQAGVYPVAVYYDNASTDAYGFPAFATHQIVVNGETGSPVTIYYAPTNGWANFSPNYAASAFVTLNAGENTVQFNHATNYAELDKIELIIPNTDLALNPVGSGYPTPTASYTFGLDSVWQAIDGIVSYSASSPHNRWTDYSSGDGTDWYQLNFGAPVTVSEVVLDLYDDGGGVRANPYNIQYSTNGTTWTNCVNQVYSPAAPAPNQANYATFAPVTAQYIRVVFTNAVSYSGMTEMQVFGPQANVALNTAGSGIPTPFASYTYGGDSVWEAIDGIISYSANSPHDRWTDWSSGDPTDYLGINFGTAVHFCRAILDIYDDGGGVRANPYDLQYSLDGITWLECAGQTKTPSSPAPNQPNIDTFTPVNAQYVRAVFTNSNNYSGVTEMQVF